MRTRKVVTLAVEIIFEGRYYEASEVVDVASDWIRGTLEDRDDCKEWTVTGTMVETELTEETA
jgi:hypothetical protein